MTTQMKNYFGISRDHSISMQSLAQAALRDYNEQIEEIKEAAASYKQDTIVSVVKCGVGRYDAKVVREVINSTAAKLVPLRDYKCDGGATPLLDSVGDLIELLEAVPDYSDPSVSFVVMAITDGQENNSTKWKTKLAAKIRELQSTDRWTFVFRVPRGYGAELSHRFGIPAGNILEWDQTNAGMETATKVTRQAYSSFYAGRSRGATSTARFFADVGDIPKSEIKRSLDNISAQVNIWQVSRDIAVRDFAPLKTGKPLQIGTLFYELIKTEKAVQDYKKMCLKDTKTGQVFSGTAAECRSLLGLPDHGTIKLVPGNTGDYMVFIQSTSATRKLPAGSMALYWPGVR